MKGSFADLVRGRAATFPRSRKSFALTVPTGFFDCRLANASLDRGRPPVRFGRVPELPEITAYLHALEPRVVGATLEGVRVRSVALLRTWDPPLETAAGSTVLGLRRLGKRIVFVLEGELFLALHLMIAGRLKWGPTPWAIPRKVGLAAFDFSTGSLFLVEAGTRRRARLHLVRGEEALAALDPGGIEIEAAGLADFRSALLRERHTLKRSLTDPRLFSGIGGAFADEILHRARLSPLQINENLSDEDVERLWRASRETLAEWIAVRIAETGDGFPEKVTAFHARMAVHGKHGQPCPVCGAPVQRIVYADRETNYCPGCQTGGRILADRALSRLLRDDWPRTLEELEDMGGG
jgi:formamidopyrimidine-DNA glycosylase